MTGNPYSPGHPWYYVLGGPVVPLSVIAVTVRQRGYQGYLTTIDKADSKSEPDRSGELRQIKAEVLSDFWKDVSRYRDVVRNLHRYRKTNTGDTPECTDVHMSVSLKHNHLYNAFAHLIRIEEMLSLQPDLFDE